MGSYRVLTHSAAFFHPYEISHFLPFFGLHTRRASQLRRSPSVSPDAGRGNLKEFTKKTYPATNRTPSPEHLKRRTRSGVEFDHDLYRRYASAGHVPVMICEVLEAFSLPRLRSFVDCTLGAAGHSSAIIEAHRELEIFVGLDMDTLAVDKSRARIEALLREELKAYTLVRNFKYIKTVLDGVDENLLNEGVDGILLDLGISSMQALESLLGKMEISMPVPLARRSPIFDRGKEVEEARRLICFKDGALFVVVEIYDSKPRKERARRLWHP